MSPTFIEFTIVAVLSVIITFVLFRWLESRADATSPFIGGTIKYGGALAGFVLIFWLLSYIYDNSFSSRIKTGIQLEGVYDISQWRPGGVANIGSATISQRIGDPEFYVVGEIENEGNPPSISFHTVSGVIKEKRLIWLFENDRREMGIGLGDIRSDQEFVMTCGDVLGNELDAGIQGNLIFTKRKETSEAKKKETGVSYARSNAQPAARADG